MKDCSNNMPITDLVTALDACKTTFCSWVNGDENTQVPLGGVMTDSLRRLVANIAKYSGLLGKDTLAELQADLAWPEGKVALVGSDPDPANNGYYIKNGPEGQGIWEKADFNDQAALLTLFHGMQHVFKAFANAVIALGFARPGVILDEDALAHVVAIMDENMRISEGTTLDGNKVIGNAHVRSYADEGENAFEIVDDGERVAQGVTKDGVSFMGDLYVSTHADDGSPSVATLTDNTGAEAFDVAREGYFGMGVMQVATRPKDSSDPFTQFDFIDDNGACVASIDIFGNVKTGGGLKSLDQADTDYTLFFELGQSLSRGSTGIPIISVLQLFANLTFASGVLIRPGDNSDIGATVAYDGSAFKPLVEERPGTHPSGETPTSSALNRISEEYQADGINPLTRPLIGAAPGMGGTSIRNLGKGSDLWNGMLRMAKDALVIANGEGKSISAGGLFWVQGEADSAMSWEQYFEMLIRIKMDYATDMAVILRQDFIPLLVAAQTAAHRRYDKDYNSVALAQWRAALYDQDIVLCCPIYCLPHNTDYLHLTADGYVQLGKYQGRAWYQTVKRGMRWQPLQPTSFLWQGNVANLAYHVPHGELVFDTGVITPVSNYGFDVWDGDELISDGISGVDIVDRNRIRIITNIDGRHGLTLTYGRGRPGDPAQGGPRIGPRGQVRDTHGDIDYYTDSGGNTVRLDNFGVMMEYAYAQ